MNNVQKAAIIGLTGLIAYPLVKTGINTIKEISVTKKRIELLDKIFRLYLEIQQRGTYTQMEVEDLYSMTLAYDRL